MSSQLSTLEQLMFSLVEVWQSSGQTQRVFCQEKELAYSKFQYWVKRYRDYRSTTSSAQPFMAVTVKKDGMDLRRPGAMELILPDGRRLVFGDGVEVSFLRALLN